MSDGDVTWHRCEGLLVEYLTDQAEILEHQHLGAVGYRNAGSFLTTVLKCVQAVISELRHILSRRPDAEYTAFFAGGLVLVLVGRVRSEEIWTVDRQIGTSHRALPLWAGGWGASTVYGHFGTHFPPEAALALRSRRSEPDGLSLLLRQPLCCCANPPSVARSTAAVGASAQFRERGYLRRRLFRHRRRRRTRAIR